MRKTSRRRMIVWGGVATLVLAACLAYLILSSGSSSAAVVEAAAVEFGDLTVELPATGNIDAVNVIDVGSPISGRIAAIHADFNQRVKKGQLLAEIEDDDYRAEYIQTTADVKAAEAAVQVAAANLESARKDAMRAAASAEGVRALYEKTRLDFERHGKLLAAGIVTQAVFDRVQAAYRTARADAAAAEALLEQAGANVKKQQAAVEQAKAQGKQRAARAGVAKRNLDYCRVISPVDGVIISRNVDVGQTVAARLQAPSLFNIAEDLSHMYVYTKLDSSDVAKVRPGLPATFTVNAFPGETFEGKLVQVRINANAEAPISRAAPVGQPFQRTLSAGVTAGNTPAGDLAASASGAQGRSATGSRSSGATSLLSTPPAQTASSAPAEGKSNTVAVYDALIEFQNPEQKLLPGMTAYVTIPIASLKDTLKVPSAALRFSPEIPEAEKNRLLAENNLNQGDDVVWIVTGEKQYRPVRVKPLLTDFVYTAVESADLKPGMQVATRLVPPKQAS